MKKPLNIIVFVSILHFWYFCQYQHRNRWYGQLHTVRLSSYDMMSVRVVRYSLGTGASLSACRVLEVPVGGGGIRRRTRWAGSQADGWVLPDALRQHGGGRRGMNHALRVLLRLTHHTHCHTYRIIQKMIKCRRQFACSLTFNIAYFQEMPSV